MFLIMAKGRRGNNKGGNVIDLWEKNVNSKLFEKNNPSWRLSSTSLAKQGQLNYKNYLRAQRASSIKCSSNLQSTKGYSCLGL
jgi:hypothetical protein